MIWLVTILSVFAGSILYDHFKTSEYDAAAELYIKQIVPELSKWDPEATKALLAGEVVATLSDENLLRAMTLFSRLGTLQSMDKPKFEDVHKGIQADLGEQTIVEYNVDAKYSAGDATINLKLLSRNDAFEIYHFNFSSEALLER